MITTKMHVNIVPRAVVVANVRIYHILIYIA